MRVKRMVPALLLATAVAACGKQSGSGEETAGPGPATGDTTGSMSRAATGTTAGAGKEGGTVTVTAAESTAAADSGTAGAATP